MGNTCACIRHLKQEEELSDAEMIGRSGKEAAATAPERVTSSSSPRLSACNESTMDKRMESGGDSRIAQQIERSKSHWSQLSEFGSEFNEEEVAVDNRAVFQALESHPTWGHFFVTFGYGTEKWLSSGELEIGEKFAEGGQAELFHAKVTWTNPKLKEQDWEEGYEWVLKVFKKDTLLRHLQSQWPHGYLQFQVEDVERSELGKPPVIRYQCQVFQGTLLEDGRFAFLMTKEDKDLRSLVDRNMLERDHDCGPF